MGNDIRKHAGLYEFFNVEQASFGFIDPKEHKQRRELLNPMFQPKAIVQLEHVLQDKVCLSTRCVLGVHELIVGILVQQIDLFTSHLKSSVESGIPINLHYGLRAITLDIITAYCFGKSTACLDAPGFEHPFILNVQGQVSAQWNARWIPFMQKIFKYTPTRVAYALLPSARPLFRMIGDLEKQIDRILRNPEQLQDVEHEIIFTHLMQPDRKEAIPSKISLLHEVRGFNVTLMCNEFHRNL
jgi:hypothetical protein